MIIHYAKYKPVKQLTNWQDALAKVLGDELKRRGMSTYDVAERLGEDGPSSTTVWNILNKQNKDTGIGTILKILEAMKASPLEFFVLFCKEMGDSSEYSAEFLQSDFQRLYTMYLQLNENYREKTHTLVESLDGFMAGLLQRQGVSSESVREPDHSEINATR
jgi:transcriptional regulator with XRE-family HTH domain